MCSDPGQEMIEEDIRNLGLNRVVVASCSPRLHEKTFQGACLRAGLNPYYFQMASVREQVSWVTEDEDLATHKAKTLSAAAVRRVGYHDSLSSREVTVHPDIMVVGGGIAGMQAALDIGNSGHRVYLVEKQPTIGGHMLQFDKTFPTLDCAACIGTPKMVEVAQNANVTLLSYSEVTEVNGFIGNYTVSVLKKPRYIDANLCTGCGECSTVCPVSMPSEWDENLGMRKAIYRSFPQAVPITYLIDKKDRAPCVQTCPAGVNVQGYVQLIKEGKYEAAGRLIMEKLPLPGVLGRVCPHPCETQCRRKEVDDAIAIRDLKRFAADRIDFAALELPEIEDKPQSVAVIGSGPAGLTAAYDLRRAGFGVTIFESLPKLGGMLRVGIPDYRLPAEILDREIDNILRLGIKTRTGVRFGSDVSLADLAKQNFSAVLLATGAHDSLKLNIPGEDCKTGVLDAVDFLRNVNLGDETLPGQNVVVIGGGNVAIDAARVAKRLGAASVTIVYRRTLAEMPAYQEEIDATLEEDITIAYLTAPVAITSQNGKVCGFKCIKTELGPPDESGRRRPETIAGSEFSIDCDAVIPAIGQRTDTSWAETAPDLTWTARKTLEVNPQTCCTAMPHVFAAGDMVTGPATVVQSVADGHVAAKAMATYLEGITPVATFGTAVNSNDDSATEIAPQEPNWVPIPDDCQPQPRAVLPHLEAGVRAGNFDEAALGLSEEQALAEAARCLNCGACCECNQCVDACEAKAINHNMKPEEVQIDVGSIILATGYDLMDTTPLKQFGYGHYPNVITSLEFERLSNATGPTGGKLLIKDENGEFTKTPKSVAILHCVGSRDVNHHEYCSRVCCMYALKYAHIIKEKVGHDTQIFDFYIDQRCYGKGYEEFYRRCQEEGTNFIRGKVAEISDQAKTPAEQGKLIAIAEDTLAGQVVRVPVDLVILCAAIESRSDALEVGRVFGVNLGSDGFFLEQHPKLGPLETATDGVFLAGACQSPKDIPDTVAQACGAAGKALSLATRGVVQVPSAISFIDPDICVGCQLCIGLCPYTAIEYDARRNVSVVNEAMCKGCGSCSGACPSGAAQVKHFKKRQIFSEFDGIMEALNALST